MGRGEAAGETRYLPPAPDKQPQEEGIVPLSSEILRLFSQLLLGYSVL